MSWIGHLLAIINGPARPVKSWLAALPTKYTVLDASPFSSVYAVSQRTRSWLAALNGQRPSLGEPKMPLPQSFLLHHQASCRPASAQRCFSHLRFLQTNKGRIPRAEKKRKRKKIVFGALFWFVSFPILNMEWNRINKLREASRILTHCRKDCHHTCGGGGV